MSLTISETKILIEKKKKKKDGIYSYKGNLYIVKDNKFRVYCDYFGNVYQLSGSFFVSIGKIEKRYEHRQKLKELLKGL